MKTKAPQQAASRRKSRPAKAPSTGSLRRSRDSQDRPDAPQPPSQARTRAAPEKLIVSRTFAQRSRLLLRGLWLDALGVASVLLGLVLLLSGSWLISGGPWRMAVHVGICCLSMLAGLACVYLGLAPALATHRIDPKGVVRRFALLSRRIRWKHVYLMGLGDDIALQAGRAEVSLPSSRGFVQRNEQTLLQWWRKALTGSGLRRVPLPSRGLCRTAPWLGGCAGLTTAAWLCFAVPDSLWPAGAFLVCALTSAALACGYLAATLHLQRVELRPGSIAKRDLLARWNIRFENVELIVLDVHELDFTIRWGRIQLFAAGRSLEFRCAGEAYETLSATIVRRCPGAFVFERHTGQVAPPLALDVGRIQSQAARSAKQAGIRTRAWAIAALGAAMLTGLVVAACARQGLWLGAAICAAATAFWITRAMTGLARAHRSSVAGKQVRSFEMEAWEDPQAAPEDFDVLDLIA